MKLISLIFSIMFINLISGKRIPRVAIVGGGIGGTSCAFFLKSLFGEDQLSVDLYEAEKVGGRLSLVNFSHNVYEEGGSIIHSRNRYMLEFLDKFNLKKREAMDGHFGLYDGQTFVFSESEWQMKTLWNAVMRYGFGFWKLKNYIDDMLKKFERIYDLQNNGVTFKTVETLLGAMDPKFVSYLHTSTELGFESVGISQIVIEEIIMASIRANYGQNLKIQKMVGSVSVAGALGSLWSVEGGNVRIPENLLKASMANYINTPVSSIKKLESGRLEVKTNSEEKGLFYDVVILAAPQSPDSKFKINFKNFSEDIRFGGKYHKTVCTLIEGTLSDKFFPGKKPFIDEILTTKEDVFFNSIGKITPADSSPGGHVPSNVWKVFTQRKMDDGQIFSLFSDVKNKYVREWFAYPHYDSSPRNDSFVLAPNLYYVNAIEWGASAMEMSVIGAKNVALLVRENFSFETEDESLTNPKEKKVVDEKEL